MQGTERASTIKATPAGSWRRLRMPTPIPAFWFSDFPEGCPKSIAARCVLTPRTPLEFLVFRQEQGSWHAHFYGAVPPPKWARASSTITSDARAYQIVPP
jgi:hypothetical protein